MPEQNIKLAVDAIVFGYDQGELYCVLIKQKFGAYKNMWSIPGGFVLDNESLSEAVKRELKEETSLEVDYLEQLYTFGDDVNRDSRFRVVSVAYFSLVNSESLKVTADTVAEEAKWFKVNELPELAFDHSKILRAAFNRLKEKIQYQPIGFNLLKNEFPFSDLENVYTAIIGYPIDRRNFRKKILSFGILDETDKFSDKKGGRPAKLFKFNAEKYKALEKSGFHFEIKLG
jgi:8-oxo-dGTP diphosphatase